MTPRDTTTGAMLENMIPPSLAQGGYVYVTQKVIGKRLGGRRHKVDFEVTEPTGRKVIVSTKWQQVPGTAEEKVPYEVLCLIDAVRKGKARHAYLVLAGSGWRLREFYIKELHEYLDHKDEVTILNLEDFCARANRGSL